MSDEHIYPPRPRSGRAVIGKFDGFEANPFDPADALESRVEFGASFDTGPAPEVASFDQEFFPQGGRAPGETPSGFDAPFAPPPGGQFSGRPKPRGPEEEAAAQARQIQEEAEALAGHARDTVADAEEKARDATARAEQLLREAEERARETVESAKARADDIEAKAYQAGFEQGEDAGRHLSEQKVESIVRRLTAVVEETTTQQEKLLKESEERLVKLAFAISLKLIHREIQQDPSVALDVVRAAVERVKRASNLTVYVSPHDYHFIERHVGDLVSFGHDGMEITIEPEESIGRGGCLIKSNSGEVDATIESMIQTTMERIRGVEPEETPSDASEGESESPAEE